MNNTALAPRPAPALAQAAPGSYLLAAFLNNFKDSTLRTMRRNLSILIDLAEARHKRAAKLTPEQLDAKLQGFDWSRVDREFVKAVHRRAANQHYSASTINSLLVVCRKIAFERMALGQISGEEYQLLCKSAVAKAGRNQRERKHKIIPIEDLKRILAACLADEKSLRGLRDFTLIATGLGAGFRAQELVGLRLANLDFDGKRITVIGKGANERTVWPVGGTMEALQRWIDARPPSGGVLFPAFAPHGDEPVKGRADQPMSYQAFYDVMTYRADLAGVARPTPHQLRHTFATNTYLATEDMFGLQSQLGHKDAATTKRYVDTIAKEQAQVRAAASWSIPEVI